MIAQLDRRYLTAHPLKSLTRLTSYALFEGRPLVTRGRWINPLVFIVLRSAARLPQMKAVERPIFIVGTGRSGTTVLGTVLSVHREVGFLNEPKALWHVIHPGEDLIGSYTRAPARYRLAADDATPEARAAAHRIYGAYLRFVGARRVVDKYPELIFRVPFVLSLFPDARLVFLVRNGWSTCGSIGRWSSSHGVATEGEVHDWWGAERRKWRLLVEQIAATDPELHQRCDELVEMTDQRSMAAVEWLLTMREGLQAMRRHPEHILLLRYEELVAMERRAVLERLLEFLELSPDARFMDYAAGKLVPTADRAPFELPSIIAGPFSETLAQLGYNASA